MRRIFAFDMGKVSIGYCVREDNDIKEANSIIIEKDHGEIVSIRDRRRVFRTLEAHRTREEYLYKVWISCGYKLLDKSDSKFKKEFASSDEDIIYNSCMLRIALLQNKKLEEWQIYKALHSAIQRRGYDPDLAWKNSLGDDKENQELIQKYTQENGVELIVDEQYQYPCYYDALRLGLWSEDEPNMLKRFIPFGNSNKVRTNLYVAPRKLVEKELSDLWVSAQKQLPNLEKISVEEFLYGEYKQSYASFINPIFKKYMGRKEDWQGVLGQKIPRFDNRIIAKCKLLPKRNVCKANTLENVSLVLLMKLKNLRLTMVNGDKKRLNPIEINEIYENWLKESNNGENLTTTITKTKLEKVLGKKISDETKYINDSLKANISGRSSFCRRACEIMKDIILEGELYPETIDISKYVDPVGTCNGITEDEIRAMLSKIGDWNNLYIPDNRDENAQIGDNSREKTDLMIGNITNPIVRNRLQIFRDLLVDLAETYGKPDEVIFEFVRDGADNSLFGRVKAQSFEQLIKKNEKENEQIKKELEDVGALSSVNFEKYKLLKMQGCKCIYSGQPIAISQLDMCEIDHVYPRTLGGNDALYNRVLCYRSENQKKQGRTPYEWLSRDKEFWVDYVSRLTKIKQNLGKKKFELLTSKPEDCAKLIDSYNGLAETSHIARVAQQIAAFIFGWGLQVDGEKRHIFVNNGATTAAIRRRYRLNSLLGDDIKKNRSNDKHHALDAICISYSRNFKYNKENKRDEIIDLGLNDTEFNQMVKKVIDDIIPYPYTNSKPFKGNTRPLETIYGLRTYGDKSYITNKIALTSIEQKEKKIKTIVDEVIKNDLLVKLEEKMTSDEWLKMLEGYKHPTKQTKVKKVLTIVSEGIIEKDQNGRERIGEFVDFGTKGTKRQFKHSKGHKGQILYYNEKGSIKVMPIYANKNTQEVKDNLLKMGCKLYNNGQVFYSGCLVNIPEEFMAASLVHPAGIYKLRTIKLKGGEVHLENNCGIEICTTALNLTKKNFCKFN